MGFACSFWGISLLALALLVSSVASAHADEPLVPALIIFGDSIADAGNNNNLTTLIKANFLPYGRDFVTHSPTGRFCNGKLATDFVAEYLGFSSYPPAYLSQEAKEGNILTGVNFASGASGLYDGTSLLYGSVSLTKQLKNYKEYQNRTRAMVGNETANATFSGAIHLLSSGASDYIQNYYINPLIRGYYYTPDRFSDLLLRSYSTFIQTLYELGARKIAVANLPPMGCLPAAITLFGKRGSNQCVDRLNKDAIAFNSKLNITSQILLVKFPGLKLVVFDIYQPLFDMVTKPSDNGFFESRKACCGTGTLETALLCNSRSIGTCSNASAYVFWDGFHPTEAANKVLAAGLLSQGVSLIS